MTDPTKVDRLNLVEILGLVFYREDFERSIGFSFEEMKDRSSKMMKSINDMKENQSDIQKIINKNNNKLDIDDILDKINSVGIENLSKEEIQFLNNYNK